MITPTQILMRKRKAAFWLQAALKFPHSERAVLASLDVAENCGFEQGAVARLMKQAHFAVSLPYFQVHLSCVV
jgi:pantoate kinase